MDSYCAFVPYHHCCFIFVYFAMENFPDGDIAPEFTVLSYDDTVAYEEQVPTHPSNDPGRSSLANRIGNTKVYLLSESSVARVGKVRWPVIGGVRKRT
jgi:hypothetical protein